MPVSSSVRNERLSAEQSRFQHDVLVGLARDPKSLPCKYFYDQRGSRLFDQICELDEYYLTRSELAIMEAFAPQMGEQLGPGVMLIEYGSGSSIKTRRLLDQLVAPTAYVPVDVSRSHLQATARELAAEYPHIEVLPVCADFTKPFELPRARHHESHDAVYFPGSTIGNFEPEHAADLLDQISSLCGTGGGLLIGIDLQKNVDVIEAAYNDRQGVTEQFNLNLLHRINRELGADFDVDQFRHVAEYNEAANRVEVYIESVCSQTVSIDEHSFTFNAGERMNTEYSHKYTIAGFSAMAAKAGLTLRREWLDENKYFAVLHFVSLG